MTNATIWVMIFLWTGFYFLFVYGPNQDDKIVRRCLSTYSLPTAEEYSSRCWDWKQGSQECNEFVSHDHYRSLYSECFVSDHYNGNNYGWATMKCLSANNVWEKYRDAFEWKEAVTSNGTRYRDISSLPYDLSRVNSIIKKCTIQ